MSVFRKALSDSGGAASWWAGLLAIRSLMGMLPAGHGYMNLDFKIKRTLRGLSYPEKLWNPVWMSGLDGPELEQLFQEPVDMEDVFSEAIELWDASQPAGLEEQTLQYFMRLYLENDILTKIDRASMMNSLEVRAPFLDIDVIDFARKIPAEYKLRHGQTKYLLAMAPPVAKTDPVSTEAGLRGPGCPMVP